MMNLGSLKKAAGSTKGKRRVGRGKGSGMGNQATKGHDGQLGRSGKVHPYAGFEGGQMRLMRVLPKRGFTPLERVEYTIINLADLDSFAADTIVNARLMVQAGLAELSATRGELQDEQDYEKNLRRPVKILARGELTKPLTVRAHRFSDSAKAKIEKVGGKAEVI